MKISALIFLSLTFVSQAKASYTSCSNGDPAKMGDAYYEINLYEDGIEFLPYEGSFTIDAEDIWYDEGTYAIQNVKTEMSSEGQTSEVNVNAMLIIDSPYTDLNAAISTDHGPFQSYMMKCVEK